MDILLTIGNIEVRSQDLYKNSISFVDNHEQEDILPSNFRIFASCGLIPNIIFKNYNVVDLMNEYSVKDTNEFERLTFEYTYDRKIRKELKKYSRKFKEPSNTYMKITDNLIALVNKLS